MVLYSMTQMKKKQLHAHALRYQRPIWKQYWYTFIRQSFLREAFSCILSNILQV